MYYYYKTHIHIGIHSIYFKYLITAFIIVTCVSDTICTEMNAWLAQLVSTHTLHISDVLKKINVHRKYDEQVF